MLSLINIDAVVILLDLMHVHNFSLSTDEWGKYIVFGVDSSLSRHIDNEK